MNDDLVQRLRSNRPIPTLPHEAADRIEAQAAEIERLEALFTNSTYEAKAMMEEIDRRGAEIQALREMQGEHLK